MPKPPHTRVTFEGLFGLPAAPVEFWNFGLNLPPMVFTTQGRVDAAAACRAAWVTHLGPLHAGNVSLTKVRVAQLDGESHVSKDAGGAYDQADSLGVATGSGSGSTTYPPQVALTVSLKTARSGPEGKGRIFLPTVGYMLSSTSFLLSTTDAGTIATKVKAFLEAIDAAFVSQNAGGANVSVVSSKGFISPVTGIRIGRALDTMRSRRRDLLEGYVEAVVNQ